MLNNEIAILFCLCKTGIANFCVLYIVILDLDRGEDDALMGPCSSYPWCYVSDVVLVMGFWFLTLFFLLPVPIYLQAGLSLCGVVAVVLGMQVFLFCSIGLWFLVLLCCFIFGVGGVRFRGVSLWHWSFLSLCLIKWEAFSYFGCMLCLFLWAMCLK